MSTHELPVNDLQLGTLFKLYIQYTLLLYKLYIQYTILKNIYFFAKKNIFVFFVSSLASLSFFPSTCNAGNILKKGATELLDLLLLCDITDMASKDYRAASRFLIMSYMCVLRTPVE